MANFQSFRPAPERDLSKVPLADLVASFAENSSQYRTRDEIMTRIMSEAAGWQAAIDVIQSWVGKTADPLRSEPAGSAQAAEIFQFLRNASQNVRDFCRNALTQITANDVTRPYRLQNAQQYLMWFPLNGEAEELRILRNLHSGDRDLEGAALYSLDACINSTLGRDTEPLSEIQLIDRIEPFIGGLLDLLGRYNPDRRRFDGLDDSTLAIFKDLAQRAPDAVLDLLIKNVGGVFGISIRAEIVTSFENQLAPSDFVEPPEPAPIFDASGELTTRGSAALYLLRNLFPGEISDLNNRLLSRLITCDPLGGALMHELVLECLRREGSRAIGPVCDYALACGSFVGRYLVGKYTLQFGPGAFAELLDWLDVENRDAVQIVLFASRQALTLAAKGEKPRKKLQGIDLADIRQTINSEEYSRRFLAPALERYRELPYRNWLKELHSRLPL